MYITKLPWRIPCNSGSPETITMCLCPPAQASGILFVSVLRGRV
jgi:hypothetical protein